MQEKRWEQWLNDEEVLERDLNIYISRKKIRTGTTRREVQGHLAKAKRNLRFSRKIIDEMKDFYEWSITAQYYAIYQAALALCALKGYKTKSHIATMALIISHYYPKEVSKKDMEQMDQATMMKEDIKGFGELKQFREKASYSIAIEYEKELAEISAQKASEFVMKAERIIELNQN